MCMYFGLYVCASKKVCQAVRHLLQPNWQENRFLHRSGFSIGSYFPLRFVFGRDGGYKVEESLRVGRRPVIILRISNVRTYWPYEKYDLDRSCCELSTRGRRFVHVTNSTSTARMCALPVGSVAVKCAQAKHLY